MNNRLGLVGVLACVCLFSLFGSVFSQILPTEVKNDEFEKLSLRATVNKASYIQLEPIFLSIALGNETDDSVAAWGLPGFRRIGLRIYQEKDVRVVSDLFLLSQSRNRLGQIFTPGQEMRDNLILEKDLDTIFPGPGSYEIQFFLFNGSGKKVETDKISIKIVAPQGNDKLAFEFLKKYQHRVIFWWKDSTKGQELLEMFVEQFGATAFGDYASFRLGLAYQVMNECEKAREIFTRIRESSNSYLSSEADTILNKM